MIIALQGCANILTAARDGDRGTVETLLAKGVNVNMQDANGWTPLMQAAFQGHKDIVKILLNYGVDVNAKDKLGITALMGAAFHGHNKIVAILLNKGADIKAKDKLGETALMKATQKRHVNILELLNKAMVKDPIRLGSIDFDLLNAIDSGRIVTAEALLNNGAYVNAKNDDGETALMKAAKRGCTNIVNTLLIKVQR